MQLIVNGKAPAGIREMTDQDIIALDGYMQRCKSLGCNNHGCFSDISQAHPYEIGIFMPSKASPMERT